MIAAGMPGGGAADAAGREARGAEGHQQGYQAGQDDQDRKRGSFLLIIGPPPGVAG
jgi:hypothetical protein